MPSTVIRQLAYDAANRTLRVVLTTGRIYLYRGVPAAAAHAFRHARIKGRYFNAHIRGRYPFEELDAEGD